jgi:hypothetical protein
MNLRLREEASTLETILIGKLLICTLGPLEIWSTTIVSKAFYPLLLSLRTVLNAQQAEMLIIERMIFFS